MSTSADTTNQTDLDVAIGVASFFRSAAGRIREADRLSDAVTEKRRVVDALDPVENTREWVDAVLELVDAVVAAREPRRSH